MTGIWRQSIASRRLTLQLLRPAVSGLEPLVEALQGGRPDDNSPNYWPPAIRPSLLLPTWEPNQEPVGQRDSLLSPTLVTTQANQQGRHEGDSVWKE